MAGTAFVLLMGSSSLLANQSSPVALASVAAVTADARTGEVIIAKPPDPVLPIASVTKLMTALAVLESGASMDEWLTIAGWDQELAKNAYSRIRIDSQIRRRDLLRIALMSSENLAAYNLALNHPGGREAFVRAMNTNAQSLGMTRTRFVDPMGLSPDNQSTARDLAKMVIAAYGEATIREYSTTRQYRASFRKPRYQLYYGNTNPLTGSSRWDVVLSKTGYLVEAGRCLVMIAEAAGKPVAMVMLNSFGTRSPLGDAGRMRRYVETGERGQVAKAARDYEQRTIVAYGLD